MVRHFKSSSEKQVECARTALELGADCIACWTLRRAMTRLRVNFPVRFVTNCLSLESLESAESPADGGRGEVGREVADWRSSVAT